LQKNQPSCNTTVVVSGLLSPNGPPGRLVDSILAGRLRIAVDDRILTEYREVLLRPKFRFNANQVEAFLRLMAFQDHVTAFPVKGMKALDPDDNKFLEVAAATSNQTLVTGNIRHFPRELRGGVRVVSPAAAWEGLVALGQ
jgi:putative PIN family toxin of toxin-antitoxin system